MKAETPFTRAGIRRGFIKMQPFLPGIFAYGIGFGLVAVQAKLSLSQALAISALVYSGSAQLAAVGVLQAGVASLSVLASTLIATILVMNARYLLFSATLRPWLGGTRPLQAYSTLFLLGDGAWLISMRAYEEGERDAGFVFGANIAAFLPWLGGTALGAFAVDFAPDPKKLGFDFMLVAFSAAMMVGMFKSRRDLVPMGVAALVAMLVAHFVNFGAGVIAAGIAGGIVAALRAPEEKA